MKKTLLLIATVALSLSANAQKFNVSLNGTTYTEGQTIHLNSREVMTMDDIEAAFDLDVHNLTSTAVSAKMTMHPLDAGAEAMELGICAGDCVPGNESLPFEVPANGEYAVPTHIYHNGGTLGHWVVKIFDTQTEGDTLSFYVAYDPNCGIDQTQQSLAEAYPNPCQGQATIDCGQAEGVLVVVDLNGRTVMSQQVQGGQVRVSLPHGIYAYGIQGQKMRKLVVK